MKVISVRNVCEALPTGLAYLSEAGQWESTRAGRVIVAPWPVVTVYERPRERVLFSALRDANPFFHVAEALWMLAGRRDAAFLDNFVRDFGARFAEPDGNVHDAYGHRWRHALGFDQLDAVVRQLGTDPGSRQTVVGMWDPYPDTRYLTNEGEANCGQDDLRGSWRTRPCNTHAYLRVRNEERAVYTHDSYHGGTLRSGTEVGPGKVLDLTVCCRSNDVVWGAYGANAVHFSVLQEYLAARLDVGVGTYTQFSNNYHCYEDQWRRLTYDDQPSVHHLTDDRYSAAGLAPAPLVHDAESFDEEVRLLLEAYETIQAGGDPEKPDSMLGNFHNFFLSTSVWPMLMAHRHRTGAPGESQSWLEQIEAPDWRAAATEWIERRTK